MSVFDKLKFWKHDELDYGQDSGLPPSPQESGFGAEFPKAPDEIFQDQNNQNSKVKITQRPFGADMQTDVRPTPAYTAPQQEQYQQQQYSPQQDMIVAKLDAIKAKLDTISLRLERLEKAAMGGEEEKWRY